MLKTLHIKDFAIIKKLDIEFSSGLNILTGETGAGKSILVQAVNLLLGQKAYSDLIRTDAKEAFIEALFGISGNTKVKRLLIEMGIEIEEDEVVIRRTIAPKGKGRIWINGHTSTLGMLGRIGRELIGISGQHAHQELLRSEQQLLYIDAFAGIEMEREKLEKLYSKYHELKSKLNQISSEKEEINKKIELARFQLNEIETISPKPEEDIALEERRRLLRNFEKVYENLAKSLEIIQKGPVSIQEGLGRVSHLLHEISSFDKTLKDLSERIDGVLYEIEDINREMEDIFSDLQYDPYELESIESRLFALETLKRKYGPTLDDVLRFQDELREFIEGDKKEGYDIETLKRDIKEVERTLCDMALTLSMKRKKASLHLQEKVSNLLKKLGFPQGKFYIQVNTPDEKDINAEKIGPTGIDEIEFFIAPNPGHPPKPLNKIASGGELSRITLALKAVLARKQSLKTIIFDEVDAGLGGETALFVGERLADLATHHQVICITHLPQIAKFADQHFKIIKNISHGQTTTTLIRIEGKERARELARMLSGEPSSELALKHAEDFLKRS